MKNFKKLFAIIAAFVLTLSLGATAVKAEETTYTLTVNDSEAGHKYSAYQIFTGDLEGDVLSNVQWGSGISAAGQAALGEARTVAEGLENGNANAFAKDLAEKGYLTSPQALTYKEGKYELSGLKPGYYLVKENEVAEGLMGTEFIVKIVKNATATPKKEVPESDKKVADDIEDTNVDYAAMGWQRSADYDIGDKVPFQLTATIVKNYDAYKKYQLTFHDKEEKGLTFDPTSVVVKVDGKVITTGYEVITEGLTDGCTFEVKFANLKDITDVKANSVITVNYKSVLNEEANIGNAGNKNTSWITFSNNPSDEQGGEENGKTPEKTVIVFTYKTIVNKVEPNGENATKALAGAEFTLEKDGKAIKVVKFAIVNNELTLVDEEGKATTFEFRGLDAGEYTLKETKTPAGYNSIDDVTFTIEATHTPDGNTSAALTKLNGNVATGSTVELTFTPNLEAGSLSTDVLNQKGTTLPETGGIGTTIFTVVGGLLVVGAAIMLITKKRMSAE